MSRTNACSYFACLFANGLARMRIPEWASPFANGPDSYLGRIITVKDTYPIPRVDDTLAALGGAQFFSTLDLASGYWQVEIDAESQPKTTFTTHSGHYKFQVMPFGLCKAPSTF